MCCQNFDGLAGCRNKPKFDGPRTTATQTRIENNELGFVLSVSICVHLWLNWLFQRPANGWPVEFTAEEIQMPALRQRLAAFLSQIRNRVLLLLIHPTGHSNEQKAEWISAIRF